MSRNLLVIILVGFASTFVSAQDVETGSTILPDNVPLPDFIVSPSRTTVPLWEGHSVPQAFVPQGTQGFSDFIGFMSNPLQNIDPRSQTIVFPIFLSGRTGEFGPLPSTDFQVYGAGVQLALNDRLSVGLNQGGFATLSTGTVNLRRRVGQLVAARRDIGDQFRTGFLDTGGFAQYTLIADEERRLLVTAGSRLVLPIGSYEVFQGKGPAYLAPYLTLGKGIGKAHLLTTAGYQFPLRTGNSETRTFNLNAHLDYQISEWFYPLVEVNWSNTETNSDVNLPLRRGFFDLGNFDTATETVTMSFGANFVLIRNKLELGAAYSTPVYTRRDFDFNSVIVKMIIRF